MMKNILEFKDHDNDESKAAWLQKEIKDCHHTYHIPDHNTAFPLSFKRKPLVAVDIGANVGSFCCYASPHFETIYSFEAVQNTYEVAKENTQHLTNVNLCHLAISDIDDDVIQLASHNSHLSGDASIFNVVGTQDQLIEECRTISLDGIYKKFNLDYIDYLKIDCEGSEYACLMGKDLSKINFMVMEIHPGYLGSQKISQLLQYLNKFFILNYRIGEHILFYKSKK